MAGHARPVRRDLPLMIRLLHLSASRRLTRLVVSSKPSETRRHSVLDAGVSA
jgi:hypothetical protein